MSSYSFSHQFYQHWTSAPQTIRAAIVQELQDITTLLQTETPFEKFVFSNHDLDAHLDDLYGAHDKQQIEEKELADKQMAIEAEMERKRLEEERLEKESQQVEQDALDKKAAKEAAKTKPQQKSDKSEVEASTDSQENMAMSSDSSKEGFNSTPIATLTEILNHPVTDDESNKASADSKTTNHPSIQDVADQGHKHKAINISLADSKLHEEHQQMIQELEVQIDDYLTEQMMQMSENLKSWLRAEVTRQLSEK